MEEDWEDNDTLNNLRRKVHLNVLLARSKIDLIYRFSQG